MQAMARCNAAARGAGSQPAGHMRFILACLFLAPHKEVQCQIAIWAIEKKSPAT